MKTANEQIVICHRRGKDGGAGQKISQGIHHQVSD